MPGYFCRFGSVRPRAFSSLGSVGRRGTSGGTNAAPFLISANDPADGGWIRAEDEAAELEQHAQEVERCEKSAAT